MIHALNDSIFCKTAVFSDIHYCNASPKLHKISILCNILIKKLQPPILSYNNINQYRYSEADLPCIFEMLW